MNGNRGTFIEKKQFPERFFEKHLFKELSKEYLAKHASLLRSYKDYKSLVGILEGTFGTRYIHEISKYDVETYRSDRRQHVGPSKVNREVTILKGMFTQAKKWGWTKENPVSGIKPLKENERHRYLEVKEIFALLDACKKDKRRVYLGPIVMVALFAGLRKREVLFLKWKDIDFERNILFVADGKGGYQRYVPLSPKLREELLRLVNRRKGDFLFHDSKGQPFGDIKKSFAAAVKRAKLEDLHFHDLRRTFATQHAFSNAEMKTIQGWLGHESIKTTGKHYIGASSEREQQEIKRLDWIMDTYEDTEKRKAFEEGAQKVGNIGGAEEDRTLGLMTASHNQGKISMLHRGLEIPGICRNDGGKEVYRALLRL